MVRVTVLALVGFALLRVLATRFGSEVPGLKAAVGMSVGQ